MSPQPLQFATWGIAEYRSALRSLLSGRIATGPSVAQLQAALTAMYSPSLPLLVNAGRTALQLALQAFVALRPERRRVLLPAYLCPSVVATVREMGLEAVPIPVGTDLNLDPTCLTFDDDVLAVVAAHMYACPARIAEIERRCRTAGVFLVDDAAQVAGVSSEGRLLGTFGDIGILSFAQSKTLVSGARGSGGALIVNNKALESELVRTTRALPPPSHRGIEFLLFIVDYLVANRAGAAGYHISRLAHRLLLVGRRNPYAPALMSNLEAGIVLAQLGRLQAILSARTRVAELYAKLLHENHPQITLPQYAPGRFLSRCFVRFSDKDTMLRVRGAFSREKIATRTAYPHWTPSRPPPSLEEISANLLELPSRQTMSDNDIRAIVTTIQTQLRRPKTTHHAASP